MEIDNNQSDNSDKEHLNSLPRANIKLPNISSQFKHLENKPAEDKQLEEPTWKDVLKIPWIKYTAIFVFIATVLNFWIFRYDDFGNGCHLEIRMSLLEWNNLEVKRALRFIRDKSLEDYRKVCSYVDTVEPDLPCGGSGGGCFHDNDPKTIVVSTLGHRNNSAFTAAIIVHETCHAIQKAEGRTEGDREVECYRAAYHFLKKVGLSDDKIPPNWVVK